MIDRPQSDSVSFDRWLTEILDRSRAEIRSRKLALRFEVDPEFCVERESSLEHALDELFRLILSTVPDGCEIYVGGGRVAAQVSRMGAGQWSARWQVVGRLADESGPPRIHPRAGDAHHHIASAAAARVQEAFALTRWTFSLVGLDGARELVARAALR
jgi:hypothetical protein